MEDSLDTKGIIAVGPQNWSGKRDRLIGVSCHNLVG